MIMKVNIVPEEKSIGQAILRYFPALCDTGFYIQAVIQLYKSVVELVAHPDMGLVPGKGRVEVNDAGCFVVPEDLFVLVAVGVV
jgi:hypothetical protein